MLLESKLDAALSITKSLVSMLKAFITKDLGLQYVAAKCTAHKKYAIKDTYFYDIMAGTIIDFRNN